MEMNTYTITKKYFYPLNFYYIIDTVEYIGNNKLIGVGDYGDTPMLSIFDLVNFAIETYIKYPYKGFSLLFFKVLRNGFVLSADDKGILFCIDKEYNCRVIQSNVRNQRSLAIEMINEHKFIEVCSHDSIHIWSY